MIIEKFYNILKILIIFAIAWSGSAAADTSVPVSPQQATLDAARAAARADDPATVIARLTELEQAGFTGFAVIRNDPDLSKLAGNPDFERILADMTANAFPCEHDPAFQAFGFWVGDWDVTLANGSPAGTNRISREQRGCVLVENWQGSAGSTGMSINYLDKASGQWVQIWNDASGNQIDIRGGLTEEGMLLEGKIHYVVGDQTLPFRGLWTALPDGRVRQYFEQANPTGDEWQPWFEGFYSRRVAGE